MSEQFAEYVNGRTIAVVGPAPSPYDQSAEVDAHDIVIRCSYGFSADGKNRARDHDYVSGVLPSGYGDRADVSYYNSGATRMAREGRLDAVLADIEWALWKDSETPIPKRGLCHELRTRRPLRDGRLINVNQITGILFHLAHYDPADVTVYGADFYVSSPDAWYDPSYRAAVHLREVAVHVKAHRQHDQETQRFVIRQVRAKKGWPSGDDRFLTALDMSREEHEARMAEIEAAATEPAPTAA